MPSVSVFQPLIAEQPCDFATLAASCGKFIDIWLAEGGEPTDDHVIAFYGLWSQSLDARGRDEEEFYRWAYPLFVRHLEEVRCLLKSA